MTDLTLPTLAFIGLMFGGVAAASVLVRAVLIANVVIRELLWTGTPSPFAKVFEHPRAA